MNYNYLVLIIFIIILGVFVVNSHLTESFNNTQDANNLKILYDNINIYTDNEDISLIYTLNKLNNVCELIWTDTPSSYSYVIVGKYKSDSGKGKSEITFIPNSNTTVNNDDPINIYSYKIKVKPNTNITYTLYRYNDTFDINNKSNSVNIEYNPFVITQRDTSQECVKCYPDGTQETIACDACDSTRPFPKLDTDVNFYKNNEILKKKLTKKKKVSFKII